MSTSSSELVEFDECSSAQFTKTGEVEALQMESVLNAKIEESIKTIEQTKGLRRSSVEEGSTGLAASSNSADSCRLQMPDDQSVPEQHPAVNKQTVKEPGQSASNSCTTRLVQSNRKLDLDLDLDAPLQQSNPLKVADRRRRRKSANDEPSAEDKRRVRLLLAENGRRRASIADGRVRESSKCGELVRERPETRPRLRKVDSKRTLSDDSDSIEQRKGSSESDNVIRRCSSSKRLSSGSGTGRNSGGSTERLQRRISRNSVSIDSNLVGLQIQSTEQGARVRRSLTRRNLLVENDESMASKQPTIQSSLGRRKVSSAVSLSLLSTAPSERKEFSRYSNLRSVGNLRASAPRVQSAASRRRELARSSSLFSVGNPKQTIDQSVSGTNNFTWTWRNKETEPTLWSNQSSVLSNTSPSTIQKASSSMKLGLSLTPPRRTSKLGDSLLSPGARRSSRAKDSFDSPMASSYPKPPLATPDSKASSNFKKTRGASFRRQASNSKIVALEAHGLDTPIVDDVVNKKGISAIAEVLKQSNQAEEDLERQKQEERQAKRSHIRARRRQTSVEWAT